MNENTKYAIVPIALLHPPNISEVPFESGTDCMKTRNGISIGNNDHSDMMYATKIISVANDGELSISAKTIFVNAA